ncbi:Hypothetical protein NTJ_14683 [Nesidiocoris tenuis]|nr:Hypothetical protein NTJ_14683 [Nesidiocoris tenuis]
MCFKLGDNMFSALHLLRSYNQYLGPLQGSGDAGVEGRIPGVLESPTDNSGNGNPFLATPLVSPSLLLPPPPTYHHYSPTVHLQFRQPDIKNGENVMYKVSRKGGISFTSRHDAS